MESTTRRQLLRRFAAETDRIVFDEPPVILTTCAECGDGLDAGDGQRMVWVQGANHRGALHTACWLLRRHQRRQIESGQDQVAAAARRVRPANGRATPVRTI